MSETMNYRRAGVNIDAGEEAVRRIKEKVRTTFRPEVLSDLGGFSGMFAPELKNLNQPVLVSGCDGVGTKLKLAFATGTHSTVGIDCVAMCVNDILVQGAEPLFFLDYLATGALDLVQVEQIVEGVAEGCRQAGCALLGGEMAEMPGFYPAGEYDLAGFVVGLVDRKKIIDGSLIMPGDDLIGLASSGLHSNGFSLVRKILLDQEKMALTDIVNGFDTNLGEELLKPTRIYVKPVLSALKKYTIKGMAHITGGGLPGNLTRVLPLNISAEINPGSWPVPKVFSLIASKGPVPPEEMIRVFNLGIGFVIAASPNDTAGLIQHFAEREIKAYRIGKAVSGDQKVLFKK